AKGSLAHAFGGKFGMTLIGFFALWLCIPLGYPGQPHVLVRFMATKDEKSVRRAGMIATIWVGILLAGAVLLGVAARAYFQGMEGLEGLGDAEKVLPVAARELLPGVLAGVMIAAVMAAICSTADSQLLVTASAVSHDLYVKMSRNPGFRKSIPLVLAGVSLFLVLVQTKADLLVKAGVGIFTFLWGWVILLTYLSKKPTDRSKFIVNRLTVLGIGLLAGGIAMTGSRVIFDFVLYAWAGLGAAFGPGLILTLVWNRTTGWGILSGIIVGFFGTITWVQFFKEPTGIYEMGPAFLAAFLAVVFVSLITSKK
ncbi:MAG: hypothetical protein QF645_01105, partial [Planctomycetota bacterium]|nr:hypothetical protein [Planctomycetota bacterium]